MTMKLLHDIQSKLKRLPSKKNKSSAKEDYVEIQATSEDSQNHSESRMHDIASTKENLSKFCKVHAKAIIAVAVTGCFLIGCTALGAEEESSDVKPSIDYSALTNQSAEKKDAGVLSFTVASSEWNNAAGTSIVVRVTGNTNDGEAFLEEYKASANQKYDLTIEPGTYTFSLATESLTQGSNIFVCAPQEIVFTGENSKSVVMNLTLDTERMAEVQRAAEEKAAQEAAAAEAARIEAEQKAQAQAEAEAAARASAANERTVYVASSGKGQKYHSNPTCSKMKNAISMTVSQAESQGYTPCSKCG